MFTDDEERYNEKKRLKTKTILKTNKQIQKVQLRKEFSDCTNRMTNINFSLRDS